jgi:hypothetical protein
MMWFLSQVTHSQWVWPAAVVPVAGTLLIEGVCWLCAFLYAESVAQTPVRLYRLTTFLFAGVAAAINYAHGSTTDPKVGVVYAIASLMGVGAFELYMHRTRHVATGMNLDEIRLWALRWRRHPRVMREVGRIRATHGLAVTRETAWRMAYLRKRGNPTIPVAISSPLIDRIMRNSTSPKTRRVAELHAEQSTEAEPSASSATDATGMGVDVLEHPVSWADAATAEELISTYWEEPGAELDATASSARKPTGKTPASSGRKTVEQAVTSTVPPAKRNSDNTRGGTGGARFKPTNAELSGPGDAKERMLRYLARAEAKGNSTDQLDRNWIAEQFHVTTRYVRNTITLYSESKDQ